MHITVKHKELLKWLKEKDKLVKEGRELTKQIEELEAKRNKCGMQIQKFKDKIIPTAEELVKPHLPEFGMLTMINIDGDEVRFDYVDKVEEYIKILRDEAKAATKPNENTTN